MKPWYLSKTIWLQIITFALIVLTLPQLGDVVPVSWIRYIALADAILTAADRYFFTSTAIS